MSEPESLSKRTSFEQKAHTAEKIGKVIESESIGAVKVCGTCGRMYAFYVDDVACPGCDDGRLNPITRYLDAGDGDE